MYNKLLVPIDEGKLSIEAVKESIGLAEDTEVELHGLYVQRGENNAGLEDTSRLNELEERAEKEDNLEFETATRKGDPVEEICNYAEDNDIDAIVMATHARTGLKSLLYGSVTHDTIRNSPCPVLVLPKSE